MIDNNRLIYLDNAATTKPDKMVVEAMLPFLLEKYGNPSGLYRLATQNKKAINESKRRIASLLHCDFREIFFTSGGTESDNWALIGAYEAALFDKRKSMTDHRETALLSSEKEKNVHIITSAIEHPAILKTCEYLKKKGCELTFLPVDRDGLVSEKDLKKTIKENTILVSVMMANNEIGTIQPIRELAEIAHKSGAFFHTDAVQAVGNIPVDVKALSVDFLSMSAHKLNGPKGVGALYIKDGLRIASFLHGGEQERGRRAGTENVPAIVGFGKACELINHRFLCENKESSLCLSASEGDILEQRFVGEEQEKVFSPNRQTQELRDRLIDRILTEIPDSFLTGHRTKRLPNMASFCFPGAEGESILIQLDSFGICASSGSACTSASREPSHVLKAIGLPEEQGRGSIRFSLSHETTIDEIDDTVECMKQIVGSLRGVKLS